MPRHYTELISIQLFHLEESTREQGVAQRSQSASFGKVGDCLCIFSLAFLRARTPVITVRGGGVGSYRLIGRFESIFVSPQKFEELGEFYTVFSLVFFLLADQAYFQVIDSELILFLLEKYLGA
jgi:hypothetical protein